MIGETGLAIRTEALRLGFSACGFAKAEPVSEEMARVLDHWTDNGYHADMQYMERNRHLRLDPTQLVPGCRTLIVVALNYYPKHLLPAEGYQIAYYAYGKDYHRVMKDKLYQLFSYIKMLVPHVEGRAFCDTAPLLERYWAMKTGLGFIGLNRQLIIPGKGSYFFLGVLAVDAEIEGLSDSPIIEGISCGGCKRCLMACPTGALTLDGIDCRRCLSYLTIEHRGPIPDGMVQKLGRRIYGCDTCQQVCPYNKNAQSTEEIAFDMPSEVADLTAQDWHELTPERYKALFKHSAIERAGYEGLMRNITSRN
ncbi:MAG: tRNA epoxyqueuosine(34) reductase QueG [Bacteroidaceae bacterium]|nr:tRNA epoxyqueuosine(34) reductase QueG [Bacteroidaceae bacterium]